jgi:hypothetical protein
LSVFCLLPQMQTQIPPRWGLGVEFAFANRGVEFSVTSLQKGILI